MIEELLEKEYRVIDILPEQVPAGGPGQYFAVEKYFLRKPALAEIHRRFTRLLLKLNCYSDFQVSFADGEHFTLNPAPELLDAWINGEQKDLCILLPGEDALITLNHDDFYMTLYHPSAALLERTERLASAEGLFVRQPDKPGAEQAGCENS